MTRKLSDKPKEIARRARASVSASAKKKIATKSKAQFFLLESDVLARHVRFQDRVMRIGAMTQDEFRAWLLGLIEELSKQTMIAHVIKVECSKEVIDETAKWYLVNEVYRIKPLRKVMFVDEMEVAS